MGTRTFSYAAPITALLGFFMARATHPTSFRWHVSTLSTLGDVVCLACASVMPSQAAMRCIGAALEIDTNAAIHAYGRTGSSDTLIPTRNIVDAVYFVYAIQEGVIHNFINIFALIYGWYHVHAIDQPMDLTVGRAHSPARLSQELQDREIDFARSARNGQL
ncbi:hypothetical protein ETB97_011439 [Aspergillus alliaceus]|uniref:Uncharacterized protein n=1 Tax=Petromyces alliaceus TaxID=209559 RepID=A0A8H6AG99_PETAA|nr:hypothetical protein ETB97_011439 [Aspergillus burnettii]